MREFESGDVAVRPIAEADWPAVIALVREAAAARNAFTYDPDLGDAQIRDLWSSAANVVVAAARDGAIAGTAKMGRNQGGPGDHVATASFLVAQGWRRRGIGRLLCRYALSWAGDAGFEAMQFNAVVSSNEPAVKAWQAEGFEIVGRIPGAFRHPDLGFVDLLVMYRAIGEN